MPAPPPDLTAASAAVVWEGKATRRALTTAMLDLASRGELSVQARGRPARPPHQDRHPDGDAADRQPVRRPATGAGHCRTPRSTRSIACRASPTRRRGYYISPDDLLQFGQYAPQVQRPHRAARRRHAAGSACRRPRPSTAGRGAARWPSSAASSCSSSGFNLPSQGLVLMGASLIVAGVVVIMLISRAMPQRTMAGRDDLRHARGLSADAAEDDGAGTVDEPGRPGGDLPWLETPDQATVWGVALGLQDDVERSSSAAPRTRSRASSTYNPWMPDLVRHGLVVGGGVERRVVRRRARAVLELAHPRLRRHVLRAGLDRQLARVERWRVGRFRRRRRRWWRRWRGRRLLNTRF